MSGQKPKQNKSTYVHGITMFKFEKQITNIFRTYIKDNTRSLFQYITHIISKDQRFQHVSQLCSDMLRPLLTEVFKIEFALSR